MKLNSKAYLIVSLLLIIISCNKDEVDTTNVNANISTMTTGERYSPNFIARHYKTNSRGEVQINGIAFFDLNHDKSSDKKFFVIQPIYQGRDTMKVVQAPYSVDSLALGFPNEVKSAENGWSGSIKLNLTDVLNVENGYWIRKTVGNVWQYPETSGVAYGYPSQGSASYWYGTNNVNGSDGETETGGWFGLTFYCQLGYVTGAPRGLIDPPTTPISSALPGSGGYDWRNVDFIYSLELNNKVYLDNKTVYYFDLKNWRYFTSRYSCAEGGCFEAKITWSGYQSLDKLCEWPEGWGKK